MEEDEEELSEEEMEAIVNESLYEFSNIKISTRKVNLNLSAKRVNRDRQNRGLNTKYKESELVYETKRRSRNKK